MFKINEDQYFLEINDILKIFDTAIIKDVEDREFSEAFDFDGEEIHKPILVFHRNIFMVPKSDTEELKSLIKILPAASNIDSDTVHCANFFISEKPEKEDNDFSYFSGFEFSEFLNKYIFFRHLKHRGIIVKLDDYNSSYFKMKYL